MGYLHYHGRNIAQTDRNIVRIAERLGVGGDPNNPKNPLSSTSDGEPYDYQDLYSLATHHLENGVRAFQIRQSSTEYVLMFSYWDANELFDIIPLDTSHKTRYISASTEPFSEEMEIDEAKMVNWLDFFHVNYEYEMKNDQKFFVRRHVSGHASKPELEELIHRINPAKIIPIHTEHCEIFEGVFGEKIVLPKYAQPIEV
jgi:mRNA degradation ribonuclease J1/J2